MQLVIRVAKRSVALLDFLKRKKEVQKAKAKPKEDAKPQKKTVKASVTKEIKEEKREEKIEKSPRTKKVQAFSYEAITEPHISEKATNLAEQNKYTFKVQKSANKHEIKKAIEGIYNVEVLSVNIIKIPAKKRRIGKTEGFKKGYSKAVVTIKEGQRIEII